VYSTHVVDRQGELLDVGFGDFGGVGSYMSVHSMQDSARTQQKQASEA
jgi:hypothetical protein